MQNSNIKPLLLVFVLISYPTWAGQTDKGIPDRPSAAKPDKPVFLNGNQNPGISLPAPPPHQAVPQVAGRMVTFKGVAFAGGSAFPDYQLQAIAAPFLNKPMGIADIEELRQRLTRHYIDHGYINSGVTVPKQPLRDGVLHFQIVEGRLDAIQMQGQGRLREGYIKNRLLPDDGQAFKVDELQDRFQLLLTDPLIERMNGRILPGKGLGHSLLALDVTRARPYQFSLLGNNYRPPSIGSEAGGASGWVRNLTGWGDYLNLAVMASEGSARYFGHWSVPVNDNGTQVHFQFDEGDSSVIEEPLTNLDIKSQVHNLEGGISHAVLNTLKRRFTVGATLAVRENETQLLGEDFSFIRGLDSGRSQTTVVRLSQDFVERREREALSFRSTFNIGINALDATPERNPNNPDSEFFSWLGQVQFVERPFNNGLQFLYRLDMQFSNEPLLPLEQIAVGGAGSVRGYRENQLVRDEGYSNSIEIHYPLIGGADYNARHRLEVVPFMDYGEAWNIGGPSDYLHSVGIGLQWHFRRLHSEFYWGHALKTAPVKQQGNIQDDGIHFQVRLDAF